MIIPNIGILVKEDNIDLVDSKVKFQNDQPSLGVTSFKGGSRNFQG